jgi:hypothetical protein
MKFNQKYLDSRKQSADDKSALLSKLKEQRKQASDRADVSSNIQSADEKGKIIQKLKAKHLQREQEISKEFANYNERIRELTQQNELLKKQVETIEQEKETLQKELETKQNQPIVDTHVGEDVLEIIQKETSKQLARISEKYQAHINSMDATGKRLQQNYEQKIDLLVNQIQKIQTVQEQREVSVAEGAVKSLRKLDGEVANRQGEINRLKNEIEKMKEADEQKVDVHSIRPQTLILWLIEHLTPSNWSQYMSLFRLTDRFNQVGEETKTLNIWEKMVGKIIVKNGKTYIQSDGDRFEVTDFNGFSEIHSGDVYEAVVQKHTKVVRLLFNSTKDKKKQLLAENTYRKEKSIKKLTIEDIENEKLLKKTLKGRKIVLISWHNMSTYVNYFERYGAKVKVLDSKKNDNQIIPTMFSNRFDLSYLFIDGVDHGTYWAAMKKLKSYRIPPESVRLTYSPNPKEVLQDAFLTLAGTKKKSALSILGNGFKMELHE